MTFEVSFLLGEERRGSLALRKKHVTGLFALAAAVFDVQVKIVLQNIVALRVAELRSGAIDRRGPPLQFHEGSDGCFVEFNPKALDPGFRIRPFQSRALPLT